MPGQEWEADGMFITVYIPFLPQHYRDRVRKDSIWEEEQKHCFVEWESPSRFLDGIQLPYKII